MNYCINSDYNTYCGSCSRPVTHGHPWPVVSFVHPDHYSELLMEDRKGEVRIDLFTHLAQQAQDVAADILSSGQNEAVRQNDLSSEQLEASNGSNSPANNPAGLFPPATSSKMTPNRTVLVRAVTGPEKVDVGDVAKYKVTSFSVPDPTAAEKAKVNWQIKAKTTGKTINTIENHGDELEFEITRNVSGFEILVLPYINSPAEKVSVLTEVERSKTWDSVTDRRIESLHPDLKKDAYGFVNRVEDKLGIQIRVTHGYRSFEEQDALYQQGRDENGKIIGDVVTNAKGGESYHNYGLALDIVEINDGKANWKTEWDKIAEIGKEFGFSWGGDWASIKDKPHFQMSYGNNIDSLKDKHDNLEAGQTYADIEL